MGMPREYDNFILRHQVIHFMVVNADVILWKCENQLRGLYGWKDPEEANAPGSFTYKQYLSYMLLNDSRGDQLVCVIC